MSGRMFNKVLGSVYSTMKQKKKKKKILQHFVPWNKKHWFMILPFWQGSVGMACLHLFHMVYAKAGTS
jgi:hypothetical protein